jgi:hypothetical protein
MSQMGIRVDLAPGVSPLIPTFRTSWARGSFDAMSQTRTLGRLFDHLVGGGEQRDRTSRLSALAILMLITNSNGVVLSKAFEQDFGVHQIGRVKPLVKPTIEGGQQVETLLCSSLQPPESG